MKRTITVTDRIEMDRRNQLFCGTCRWLEAFADSCARFPTKRGLMRQLKIATIVSGTAHTIGEGGYLRCIQCRKAEATPAQAEVGK